MVLEVPTYARTFFPEIGTVLEHVHVQIMDRVSKLLKTCRLAISVGLYVHLSIVDRLDFAGKVSQNEFCLETQLFNLAFLSLSRGYS